jgi:hypothetical protein
MCFRWCLALPTGSLKASVFWIGTFLYTISTMHCMTVSLSQGGEGLGACGVKKKRGNTSKGPFLNRSRQTNWRTTSRTTGMWSENKSMTNYCV